MWATDVIVASSFIWTDVLHADPQEIVLRNGTEAFEAWENPPPPVYMQFYFFNLTNPLEVLDGDRPAVVEIGPYTYRWDEKYHLNSNCPPYSVPLFAGIWNGTKTNCGFVRDDKLFYCAIVSLQPSCDSSFPHFNPLIAAPLYSSLKRPYWVCFISITIPSYEQHRRFSKTPLVLLDCICLLGQWRIKNVIVLFLCSFLVCLTSTLPKYAISASFSITNYPNYR